MEKETELLSRLAANHLYLGQFEPLRATLLALRVRNPDLALAILQTIVAKAGQFNHDVVWSPSCPSPSLLTYLSLLELLDFNNAASAWGFDPGTLRLRVEFLLIVQMLIDRASDKSKQNSDGGGYEGDELVSKSEGLRDLNGELGKCVEVLGRILELGVNRLNPESRDGDPGSSGIVEEESSCLTGLVREEAYVFDSLCFNIHMQVRDRQGFDPSLAITMTGRDERHEADLLEVEEHNVKVMGLIQRRVQFAHLEAMKECLNEDDEEGAILHIRYLHLGCGTEEMEYRYV